jgi:predicted nucleic acid-binding protein
VSVRVILLVPDAGPLISLAKADELRLLRVLGLPVFVVDHVLYETTRDKRLEDAVRIEAFLQENKTLVQVFETAVGKAAAKRRAGGESGRQPGQGEAAIAEFLARLDELTGDPDAPVMLLYEDGDIRKSRFVLPENVHVVSTKGLLVGMERRGLISSAEAVWHAINTAGRSPSNVVVDEPGATGSGRTRW